MLPVILFACLAILISLANKLYFLAPHRKLNIYLALIPGMFSISTVLEINIYYAKDAIIANQLYHVYQCFAFFPVIFNMLSFAEYIKIYTTWNFKTYLKGINILVVAVNCFWTLLVIIYGPTSHIFLSGPGKWSIDPRSMSGLFILHTISSLFWLILIQIGFVYLMFNSEGFKKKMWFRTLSFLQLFIIISVFFL